MSTGIRGEPEFSKEDIVRYLLELTETLKPPTNAERIASSLGLSIRGFFHNEHGLNPDIRAYLLPAKREIGISKWLSPHRRKFSILHEVGHFVIPGHTENLKREAMILDDDRSLADHSVVNIEMEANQFAADCIFQLDRLQTEVANEELIWPNVCRIARVYDASVISTARRWVEGAFTACALLVFVPVKMGNAIGLRHLYVIASEVFRQRYFVRLSAFTLREESMSFRAFRDTRGHSGHVETLSVNINNAPNEFDVMLFSTQYSVYGLIVV